MNDCKHLIQCHEPQKVKNNGIEKTINIAIWCVICGAHINDKLPEADE